MTKSGISSEKPDYITFPDESLENEEDEYAQDKEAALEEVRRLKEELSERHDQAEYERERLQEMMKTSHDDVKEIKKHQKRVASPIYGVLIVGASLAGYGFVSADIVLTFAGAGMALISLLSVYESRR